jgi:hypothetical protein
MASGSYPPEDFELFVTKYENRLYRTALAITANVSDADPTSQIPHCHPSVLLRRLFHKGYF